MSWKIALVVALVTGLITALVCLPVADRTTKALKVPDREGGRAMAIFFLLVPAAFIGGALLGLLGSKFVGALEWAQFWKATGVSLLMSLGVMLGIAGAALLSVVRPPTIQGRTLTLQIEVRLPKDLVPGGSLNNSELRMSLWAGSKDNQYCDVDTNSITEKDGVYLIRAKSSLNSVAPARMLSLSMGPEISFVLDMPLQPAPKKEDLEWTDPLPTREARLQNGGYVFTQVMMRYRVEQDAKPSP